MHYRKRLRIKYQKNKYHCTPNVGRFAVRISSLTITVCKANRVNLVLLSAFVYNPSHLATAEPSAYTRERAQTRTRERYTKTAH